MLQKLVRIVHPGQSSMDASPCLLPRDGAHWYSEDAGKGRGGARVRWESPTTICPQGLAEELNDGCALPCKAEQRGTAEEMAKRSAEFVKLEAG